MAQQPETKCSEAFGKHDSSRYEVTGNIVRSIASRGAVYGSKAVSKGIYQWVVKYETGTRCCGAIGIASNHSSITEWGYNKANTVGFYHRKSQANCKKWNFTGSLKSETVESKLNSGDTVRILLNYDKKIVTFFDTNGQEIFTVNNIPTGNDISYRLWIDTDGKDDKYTILKSNSFLDSISLKTVSDALKSINKVLQKANEKVKSLSMKELSKLKKETSEFLDECKEFEQNFENIKKEVQVLDKTIDAEMNPDTKKYKSWKTEQICRYVLSLEKQRFAKYMDALTAALEKQQITGEDLPEIEANDLYTMGIDNFKDRKALAKYFKNLNTNEGDIATEHH
eukprot:525867_1